MKISLKRGTRTENESAVTSALRKKVFATLMFTRMKLVEWEIAAEISVAIQFVSKWKLSFFPLYVINL